MSESPRDDGPESNKTNPNDLVRSDLEELFEGYCSANLSDDERKRLEDELRSNAAARVKYVRYMTVHAGLRGLYRGEFSAPFDSTTIVAPGGEAARPTPSVELRRDGSFGPNVSFGRQVLIVTAIAAGILLAVSLLGPFDRHAAPPVTVVPLATIEGEHDTQWSTAGNRPSNGRAAAGSYFLEAGLVELRLASGVRLVVEGPTEWELIDTERVFLRSGSIVARMGERKVRFAIVTDEAQLHDLGTEFGVSVGPAGDTLVQVYDGRVLAEPRNVAAPREGRLLKEGESLRIASTSAGKPVDVRFEPGRFVRELPAAAKGGRVNHNQPSVAAVRVPPVDEPVEIDGKLDDWNLDHAFRAACSAPFDESHAVEGAMRYGDTGLYLAARIRDPFPLHNVTNPDTDPELGWRGGGVQVRLCLNRRHAWPVNQVNPRLYVVGRPVEPAPSSQEDDRRTVHLTLWNYAPRSEPCLHVHYGMTFRTSITNPTGFRGAYQPAADGRGYTLEYFMPWSVLNAADDPPQAGDVLAANWTVHWSGPDGRLWRGQLIEICNPEFASQVGRPQIEYATYNRTIFWGRAEFVER
jgi:hypothetical protein